MVGEKFLMCASELGPELDVGHKHARADDMRAIRAKLAHRALDDFETAFGLGVRIVRRKRFAVLAHGRGTCDVDVFTRAQRAAVADLFFPGCAGKRALHFQFFVQ